MQKHLFSLYSLFISLAILLVGHGLQLSLMPLRAEALGWTSTQVGWTSAFYFAGFLLGCFTIPSLVRAVGHIRVFTVLTSTMTAALLGLSLTDGLVLWLILRSLTGWSITGIYLVVESWLNEVTGNSRRGSMLSAYTITALLSMASGQLLLNVAEPTSHQIVVIAAIWIVLAAVPVGLARVPQPIPVPTATFSPLLVLRKSWAAPVASFVSGLVSGCFYGLGPFYGKTVGLKVSAISLMMAAGILGGVLFQWPLGRTSDFVDRRLVLLGIMLGGFVICALVMVLTVDLLPYLVFLFGGCVMPIYALALAHASDNVEASFLEVGTGILIVHATGAVVGPIVAASLMAIWGPQSFFGFCSVVLALGSIAMFIFVIWRPALRPHFSPFETATTVSAQGAIELDPRSDEKGS
jgi:MFS family permease